MTAKSKKSKQNKRSPRFGRFLFMCCLVAGIVGYSYWYKQQPEPKQEQIQDKAGEYLDKGAKSIGTAVESVTEMVSGKVDSASSDDNSGANSDSGSSGGIFDGLKETISQPFSLKGQHTYAGYPQPTRGQNITTLKNKGFVVGYCETKMNPLWVSYRVFRVDSLNSPKRPSRFKVDDRTKAKISHNDYTHSGYDRGHMAPNYAIATRYGAEGQLETFFMSNIIPQKANLNRRIWKDLEQAVAKDYGQDLGEVWVTTGPIFDDDIQKLASGVEIPDACYKIIVDEDGDTIRAMAFIMSQDVSGREKLTRFLVSIDEIENATGLDFFSKLPDDVEDRLEREKAPRLW